MLAITRPLAAGPVRLKQALARRLGLNRKSSNNNLSKPRTFAAVTSGRCVVRELDARKIPHRYLSHDQITNPRLVDDVVLEFHINGIPYYFTNEAGLRVAGEPGVVPGRLIDGEVALFIKRKDLTNSFLRKRGISVPQGRAFSRQAGQEAEIFFNSLCASVAKGVCVKPTSGSKGDQVHVGVRDRESFREAFSAVAESYARVLLEETVQGPVYRFTMVAGRVCMVEYMRPANVEGDGDHTISELILLKNKERESNPTHLPLQLGEPELAFLDKTGLRPDDVPETGRLVFLSSLSNCHQGGDCIEVGATLHSSYVELLEDVFRLFPGLVLCGADVAIPHIDRPATPRSYHVLELNCCPGFSTCHHPWRGRPHNVAGAILDHLLTDSAEQRPRSYAEELVRGPTTTRNARLQNSEVASAKTATSL